ncbi:MAG TPA: IclR family transcriptional regulator [Verrucomicrobiae bacterium]
MKLKLPTGRRVPVSSSSAKAEEKSLGVPALERGLAMLEFLGRQSQGATLLEITTALEVSAASAFRIATALEELGYLRREEGSKKFFVTRKLLSLGQPQAASRSLVECAVESMRQVLVATGETTQLCCLAEDQCVVIDQLASVHPFKYIVDLGSRAPLHCAAPGKAMMAFLPEDELAPLLAQVKLEKHTDRTITSRKELRGELERIRANGYAVDHGEHFDGIHCVAAPLLNHHGHAIAAITIAGPSSRIPASRFAEFGAVMIAAANEAARKFLE